MRDLNDKQRNRGLTAKEMLLRRHQGSGKEADWTDLDLGEKQLVNRQRMHKKNPDEEKQIFKVGDNVLRVEDGDKLQAKELYRVTDVQKEGDIKWYIINKFEKKFMARSYKVRHYQIKEAPGFNKNIIENKIDEISEDLENAENGEAEDDETHEDRKEAPAKQATATTKPNTEISKRTRLTRKAAIAANDKIKVVAEDESKPDLFQIIPSAVTDMERVYLIEQYYWEPYPPTVEPENLERLLLEEAALYEDGDPAPGLMLGHLTDLGEAPAAPEAPHCFRPHIAPVEQPRNLPPAAVGQAPAEEVHNLHDNGVVRLRQPYVLPLVDPSWPYTTDTEGDMQQYSSLESVMKPTRLFSSASSANTDYFDRNSFARRRVRVPTTLRGRTSTLRGPATGPPEISSAVVGAPLLSRLVPAQHPSNTNFSLFTAHGNSTPKSSRPPKPNPPRFNAAYHKTPPYRLFFPENMSFSAPAEHRDTYLNEFLPANRPSLSGTKSPSPVLSPPFMCTRSKLSSGNLLQLDNSRKPTQQPVGTKKAVRPESAAVRE